MRTTPGMLSLTETYDGHEYDFDMEEHEVIHDGTMVAYVQHDEPAREYFMLMSAAGLEIAHRHVNEFDTDIDLAVWAMQSTHAYAIG